MPEGPEVRRYADLLDAALRDRPLTQLGARTKRARVWLAENESKLLGRKLLEVRAHGKNLLGRIEGDARGDFYFYSHLMMWGRWQIVAPDSPEATLVDRRERARIANAESTAILWSAPIFEIGQGDPFALFPALAALGPDTLPYPEQSWAESTFLSGLNEAQNREREIGAALLDQGLLAGIGNYLRAEILYECRLDPWRKIGALTSENLSDLNREIPRVVRSAYENGGATVPENERQRMRDEANLVYAPGRDWGTRHAVFRRTNLPCLRCGDTIRQRRQTTRVLDDEEKTRIIYFCPTCQSVADLPPKPKKRTVKKRAASEEGIKVL